MKKVNVAWLLNKYQETNHSFKGHFPEYAVMPGVLITEALAQTGAVAILNSEEK